MINHEYWKNSKEVTIKYNKECSYNTESNSIVSNGTVPFGLSLVKGILKGVAKMKGTYYFLSDRKYKFIVE